MRWSVQILQLASSTESRSSAWVEARMKAATFSSTP